MAAIEQQVRLDAKLYEMRDTVKRLLGDRYSAHMAEVRKMIEGGQERMKITEPPLVMATKICTANSLRGLDVAYIMTGAVEMVEPSVEQQPEKP